MVANLAFSSSGTVVLELWQLDGVVVLTDKLYRLLRHAWPECIVVYQALLVEAVRRDIDEWVTLRGLIC
jgi:hypothetical protein